MNLRFVRSRSVVLAPALLSFSLVAFAAGCTVEAETRPVRYEPAPPPPPPPQAEIVVESEPPPPPPAEQEAPPPPPGPEFVWIGGYHRWDGHGYVWVRGRYERRPHAAAHWRAAHWEGRGRGHVWIEGRWE
jgi:hypothetical protein